MMGDRVTADVKITWQGVSKEQALALSALLTQPIGLLIEGAVIKLLEPERSMVMSANKVEAVP
jgi:hypothetical protein